ncbi:MAG: serine/threonine protein kinase [Solirubrobacterales bacterium]|nr:serine/threonine protein kinase [Solirubrobacterales bacterium]
MVTAPVGTLLSGRYRLDAKIGAGGMSTVYRAFDTTLERQVAIKVMDRDIARDADQLERFRREARAVAQLNHPHVVGVIDAGEDDATQYIVFEHIQGETLKDRIRRLGKLPISEAVAYAIEIARALGAAHERGIVHRDVKPQNVLLDEEGSAKVTDFGIARTLDQAGLTQDGRVLGTTDYVSPEQALGHHVTGQSDLYSLGIVLFEMLTGDVPFKGEGQVAVAMKHVREDLPDVQIRRPEVSSALAAVVDRATAKDLDERYPDDATFISDLEDVLSIELARSGHLTSEATAVFKSLPPQKRRRVPAGVLHPTRILIGLLIIAAATVGGIFALKDNTTRGTRNAAGPPPRSQPGIQGVSIGQNDVHDYDPNGTPTQEEHPEVAKNIIDANPSTSWKTENYTGGTLGGKPGVGIYLDAKPSAKGARLEIDSPTPGWRGTIYGSKSGVPKAITDPRWVAIGDIGKAAKKTTVRLDGTPYRYYLVWIQALPPGRQSVELSEVRLYQRK